MKIFYQSFVNETAAPGYWGRLTNFLTGHARTDTEIVFQGITPFDSLCACACRMALWSRGDCQCDHGRA